MKVELNKIDIINMLKGTCCPYDFIDEFSKRELGTFSGGFSDEWIWNEVTLFSKSMEELLDIYNKIKTYWICSGLWN